MSQANATVINKIRSFNGKENEIIYEPNNNELGTL